MAKLTCLLALFVIVVVCAEAVRIDTAVESEVRPIAGVRKNDPRCRGETGMFAISKDCKKYIKCVKGDSREMKCPEGKKFYDRSHCVSPKKDRTCTVRKATQQGLTDADPWCPRPGGTYTLPDCRKYYKCNNYKPTVITCDKGMFYSKVNGMCIKADKCPNPKSEEDGGKSVCKKANVLLPDKGSCLKYIKCVNFIPQPKNCPPGRAFDAEKSNCTKEKFKNCKNNDILHIEPDDE